GETERHSQGQLKDGTDLTAKKNDARVALETGTLKICSALAAYATATSNPDLKTFKIKYQLSENQIRRMRDMQLFSFAYTVYGDALPYAALLGPYVEADEVAELKDLADNFNELLPQKRTQQSKSVLSTQNLEDAIGRIDLLLEDTIDVLIKPWESKEPDFFKAYKNARMIVDAASRKTKKIEEKPVAVQEK
ncbi:MAG TPA: hypothetical protein VIK55_15125, partial [Paludibacter sp.]